MVKLSVWDLTLKKGSEKITQGISFSLEHQKKLALIGPSGSGKTSLVRGILGLWEKSNISGRIYADDQPLQDAPFSMPLARRNFAYVPQDIALWGHLTVRETLGVALRFSQGKALTKSKEELQLSKLLKLFGLIEHQNKKPFMLSGGEKQRLALARALVKKPCLLILDEPFFGLDVIAKEELIQLILRQQKADGFSLILISHDLVEALTMSDVLLIMDQGKLIWFGEKTALKSDCFLPHWNPFQSRFFDVRNPSLGRPAT
jgi:ABC-type multidrug transport system ATPase subunit